MDTTQSLGIGAPAVPSSSGQAALQRPSKTPPFGPEWGNDGLPTPWWEAVNYPCVQPRDRFGAAESGSALATSWHNDRFCSSEQKRVRVRGTRGGGFSMARIFAVLTALASLFLIAGASAKY